MVSNPNPSSRPPKGIPKPPLVPNRNPLSWMAIGLILLLMFLTVVRTGRVDEISYYPEFLTYVDKGLIKSVRFQSEKISGEFTEAGITERTEQKKGESKLFEVVYTPAMYNEKLMERLVTAKVEVKGKVQDIWLPIFWQLLPIVVLAALVYFFFLRNLRSGGGGMLMNFGRSRHKLRGKEQKITFDDVAGIEEAKEEVAETIEFLKNPKKFKKIGGRIPRGLLLIGPPGCGKTLLAKAIAGEADVPFFSIAGSDFVEMFVGVGASRVRDLFKQAKENCPCIIFLDEIDAIGKKRGPGFVSGGHDEREQTLNAILVEMDGFDTDDQVIVIAATNRADILDPALTRPGRFDRSVNVPLPDLKGRAQILKVHARKVKLGPDVDFERLARVTPMFSGAELEAVINEAAISASMANKDFVEMTDLEEARDKIRWGRAKKSRSVDESDKRLTAYHEAGHALVQSMLKDADPLHKVSIIPRGSMGGATFALPEKDRHFYTRRYCMALLQVCYGGRIAEELFCDDISSGAQSDIQQATLIAREMVMTWGMGEEMGLINFSGDPARDYYLGPANDYSQKTAERIDQEIKKFIDQAYKDSRTLIESNKDKLEAIAKSLLKYETLDAEDVRILIEGGRLDKPTVGDLLAQEHQKTQGTVPPAAGAGPAPATPGN